MNKVTAGDGAGDNDGEMIGGFSLDPFTVGVGGFPADIVGADTRDGWCTVVGDGEAMEGAGDGDCECPLAG